MLRQVPPRLNAALKATQKTQRPATCAIGQRISGIEPYRLIEHGDLRPNAVDLLLIASRRLQIKRLRFGVARAAHNHPARGLAQPRTQRADNAGGDAALDFEHIAGRAVIASRPDFDTRLAVDQLRADAHCRGQPPNTAGQDMGHTQFIGDARQIGGLAKPLGRRPANDLQTDDLGQGVAQFFGQTIGKIGLAGVT